MESNFMDALPDDLRARLNLIIQTAPRFWEQKPHRHYTNQGASHSKRVQQHLEQLVKKLPDGHSLSNDETFVVSAAAWLYETGMQSPNLRPILNFDYRPGDSLSFLQLQEIRAKKHLLTKQLILDSVRADYQAPSSQLRLIPLVDEYTWLIAEVCRWCSDEPLTDVPKELPVEGRVVHIRLLVALLRLADQLYIDSSRVNLDLLERANLPIKEFARWWVYRYVQALSIERNQIRFFYFLPSVQKKYLESIRTLIEPNFEYDNNPIIRYLWNEHSLHLRPHREPTIRYGQLGGTLREMSDELINYLRQGKEKNIEESPMPQQDGIKALITKKQRRLQKLKERQAISGINTPAEILIEIEDIENEIEQLQAKLAALEEGKQPEAPQTSDDHPEEAQNRVRSPNSKPIIENPNHIPLPAGAKTILKTMFDNCQRVVVKKRFQGGFSGGQVFLISPIRENGQLELPAVVKLASTSLIQKEQQAYDDFIRDRLPNSIGMKDKPVLPSSSQWGGLRYPLAGGGTFKMESLYDYCRRAAIEDIRFVLEERLLKVIERVMQFSNPVPEFHLHASYERYLPANLLIEIGSIPAGLPSHSLNPGSLKDESLQDGDYVRLEGFVVSKVDLNSDTIDLNLPRSTNGLSASYTIRLKIAGTMPPYKVGQAIDPIEGVVLETRRERLEAEASKAMGQNFNPTDETIAMPDGASLSNPLTRWQTILNKTRHIRIGAIHGDLNMENILVDPATRDVSLIDFADARRDHVLHDFLRLEAEVVVKIIAPILHEHHLPPQAIYTFYRQLHLALTHSAQAGPPHPALQKPWTMLRAIRRAAANYLFKRDDWAEYYLGLTIYLLGALKFGNLDEMAKQTAFWGSAAVGEMVKENDLEYEPREGELMQVANEQQAMWREQLDIHRKQLHRLEIQLAKFGSLHAPLYLLSQVDDEKAEIKRLEQLLKGRR